ncbi:MAG: hypothetical protein AAF846_16835 [Chloroflexota bacterium]
MPGLDLGYVISPIFLITFGLVGGFFLPVAYSVWVTWEDNKHKADELRRRTRAERRARWQRRNARNL